MTDKAGISRVAEKLSKIRISKPWLVVFALTSAQILLFIKGAANDSARVQEIQKQYREGLLVADLKPDLFIQLGLASIIVAIISGFIGGIWFRRKNRSVSHACWFVFGLNFLIVFVGVLGMLANE